MLDFFNMIFSFETDLNEYIALYGKLIYILLFLLIFAKSSYLLLTFLPVDIILFTSGTLASLGHLDLYLLLLIFFIATVAGDAQNYAIGKTFMNLEKNSSRFSIQRFLSEKSLDKTKAFLNNYGKLAIMFSRFVPLICSLIPFISGFTRFSFKRFIAYNSFGAAFWTLVWVEAGYLLGNIPWVAEHLFLTLLLVTLLSFVPALVGFILEAGKNEASKEAADT